ncbi:MAG TPA: hypothetical protein VMD59_10965 [Acidimicrobiales bacterium]|nr:hypothetical protein [Acidimicrobiales bacterium]
MLPISHTMLQVARDERERELALRARRDAARREARTSLRWRRQLGELCRKLAARPARPAVAEASLPASSGAGAVRAA